MSKFIGRLVELGVGRETSRGVAAASVYKIPQVSLSFDDKVTKARSMGALGKLEDSEEAFVTTKYGQGDIEGEIRASSFGLILYALLGSLSTAGPSDSAYTHSFTVSHNNQHQSLSLLAKDANTTELYRLAMIDSLQITAELDEVVRFSAGFMSKQAADSGATMPTLTDEYKFTKKHVFVKLAANVAGLAAASVLSIKRLNLTIAKNSELDDVLGTAEPEDIVNRQLSVEGEIMLNYNDETYKNLMKNNTVRAMEIHLQNTDELIGSSSRAGLKFQFPNVDFYDWNPDYALDEISKQTISFKASRDVANNIDSIQTCQLVNAVASY